MSKSSCLPFYVAGVTQMRSKVYRRANDATAPPQEMEPYKQEQRLLDDLLGTQLNLLTPAALFKAIESGRGTENTPILVGHHNMHSLLRLQKDPAVVEFYSYCRYCYLDGQALAVVLRLLGVRHKELSGFSLMNDLPALLQRAEGAGWRVAYIGSQPGVIELAEQRFRKLVPKLAFRLYHGYQGNYEQTLEDLAQFAPDLLLVGMGMPKQELWILRHLQRLPASVILQAGGTLDYLAGEQARPPRWIYRIGFAWFYRLVHSPRRLGRRYLLEPLCLVPRLSAFRQGLRSARKGSV